MTPKEQEIQRMMPTIAGKAVKVWCNADQDPTYEGTVNSSTGTYLILKHVTSWAGHWSDEKIISIGSIKKIELA